MICTSNQGIVLKIVSEYDQENYKLLINPWHREKEPHNNHKTQGRQTKESNQLSFPIKMIAKLDEKSCFFIENTWICHSSRLNVVLHKQRD